MPTETTRHSSILFMSFILFFAFTVTASLAQQKISVAGRHTLATITDNALKVGDTKGHIVSLDKFEGSNVSTGANKFMDRALDAGMTFGDAVNGNGRHEGYGTFFLNGDTIFWRHKGKTVTTLSGDGRPVTTMEGTFTYTNGTGKYKNIQGNGTYKGKSISKMIMIVDWQGEYFIKK